MQHPLSALIRGLSAVGFRLSVAGISALLVMAVLGNALAARKPENVCVWTGSACVPNGDICRPVNNKFCTGDSASNCHCVDIPPSPYRTQR